MRTRGFALRIPVGAALMTFAAVSFSPPAQAQEATPPVSADPGKASAAAKLVDEGTAFYQAREYRHAAEKFFEAYALDADPNLLYNIAKCYEAVGDTAGAIEKYETFLSKPGGDPIGRGKAQHSLDALKAGGGPVTGQSGAGAGKPGGEKAAPPESKPPYTLIFVTLGVGVAAATVGTIVYAMGASDHKQVTSAPGYNTPGQVDGMTSARAQELVDSGTSKKTIGGVTIAVGGAAIVTSAVIYFVTRKSNAEAVTVGVAPALGGGSFLVQGRF